MRIDEINAPIADRGETSLLEIQIASGRPGREGIREISHAEWIGKVFRLATRIGGDSRNGEGGKPEERRLAVELEVVLAFQHIVKDAESAPNTGLSASARGPGEAETRRPII